MANLTKTQVWFDDGTSQTFNAATPPPQPPGPGLPSIPAGCPFKTVTKTITFPGNTWDTTLFEDDVWYDQPDTAGDISNHNGGVSHPPNVKVAGGLLILISSSPTPTNPQSWLSGYLDTAPYYVVKAPCCVAVRAQMPKPGRGMWPAFSYYEDGLKGATQYAEVDALEWVWTPGQSGPQAFQTWHPPQAPYPPGIPIAPVGYDLTGWHDYAHSIATNGDIQFYFDGKPNGSPIAGGQPALQPMFLSFTNTTGGTATDGWAGVPDATTPNPSELSISGIIVSGP